MVRKRASLTDQGEEILGLSRGGQGADILFGTGMAAKPAPEEEDLPEEEAEPEEVPKAETEVRSATLAAEPSQPVVEEGVPSMDATLDEQAKPESPLSAKAAEVVEELPEGEADLGKESELDILLGAEAKAAEAEAGLPELATTPAVAGPPPDVVRPAPAPPPEVKAPPQPATLSAEIFPEVPTDSPPPPPPPVTMGAPPSTATGARDLSMPRPVRYVQLISEDVDLTAEEISPDAAAAERLGLPEKVELTSEERAELLGRRSVQNKLNALDEAIDKEYERILRENISVSKPITDWCHNLLAEARTIVLNRQVDNLPRAEWCVEQVRARIDRASESRKQANRYSWPIAIWGVVWFVVLVYLVLNWGVVLRILPGAQPDDPFISPDIFLRALFFGGIGGVAAVFYHLFKYVSERTFDSQYVLSFVGKPFMGMILGSMIYLTVAVLMRVLGLIPAGLQQQGEPVTDIMYMAILFFVAMAAGFKENVAFDLLNRMIKTLLRGDEEGSAPAATTPPSH